MLWFIHNKTNKKGVEYTKKFFDNYFDCEIFDIKDLSLVDGQIFFNGQKLELPKIVYYKTGPSEILKFLCERKIECVNEYETINSTRDKIFMHKIAQNLDITQPLFCEEENFEQIKEKLGLPFVLKNNFGMGGKEVFLIDDKIKFEKIKEQTKKILCQKFIDAKGEDYRCAILDKKVLTTFKRVSSSEDFRSNICLGGKVQICQLPKYVKENAELIAEKINLKIGAIDFLFDGDDYYFCEANSNISYSPLLNIGFPIYDELIKYFQKLLY